MLRSRWLSYSGSIAVVCKNYASICLALESIYADAADLSCDAGGLLLELRNSQTLYLVCFMNHVLQPLARLSQALQSSDGNISTSMTLVKSTISGIKSFDYSAAQADMTDALQKLEQSGVQMTAGDSAGSEKAARQFIAEIVSNLEMRFSDEVSKLCSLHDILKKKHHQIQTSGTFRMFLRCLTRSCWTNGSFCSV